MKIAQRVGWLEATNEQGLQVIRDQVVAHRQAVLEVLTAIDDRYVLQEILDLL